MADKKRLIKKQGIEIEEFINQHPNLDAFTKNLMGKVLQFGYNLGSSEAQYDASDNPWDAAGCIDKYERIKHLLGLEEEKSFTGELRHPINLPGYGSPEETAEYLANLNYFSSQRIYNSLIVHYKNQAEHNKNNRGKTSLSKNLEEVANAFSLVDKAMKKVCDNSEKHTENPYDLDEKIIDD